MFKNNIKSIWRYNDIKIVFSEPSIQAPEKIVDVEDAEDILYYYYTLTVYRYVLMYGIFRRFWT